MPKGRRRGAHAHGGHVHVHEDHDHSGGRASTTRKMVFVLCLTSVLMVAELIAGIAARSLALIADAGHMLSDVAAQALALAAMWFAARPPSPKKSFGYYRTEILASLINGVALICISGFIIVEGLQRVLQPESVEAPLVLLVATIGLIVNIVSMRVLHSVSHDSLNIKAAYLELLGDTLASAGVVVAAVVIIFTGWYIADPIISILIGLSILPRTWLLIAEATNILMEGTPGHIDMDKLHAALLAVPGVASVHDIHVWSITSGFEAMCAHVRITQADEQERVLADLTTVLRDQFGIDHTTIQIELPSFSH
jgi:cobalt-zinc-cadmium efflux system protein